MSAWLEPARALAAGGATLAYLAVCGWAWRQARAARRPATAASGDWLVAYASQTGSAQQLAQHTAQALAQAGATVSCQALDALSAEQLEAGGHLLLVLSTSGQGDAPDNGARFARNLLTRSLNLGRLSYGLLALGDRDYADFCGFGRRVGHWLRQHGARPLFAAIEVHRHDADAIGQWRQHISRLAHLGDAPAWSLPAFAPWRLLARAHLNPGSPGAPVYQLDFAPASGVWPAWQAGDLAQLALPEDSECLRDYSIASLPSEQRLRLLVRVQRRADGQPGRMSGWLSAQAALGQHVPIRLRTQSHAYPAEHGARPLILIGNGVGLAGLRAQLKARIDAGLGPNWLLFGERSQAHDSFWAEELDGWRDSGQLHRLDRVFSREPDGGYVQHALFAAANVLRAWVAAGAAVYLCGSRQGMAAEVDLALRTLLGEHGHAELLAQGRYVRDVF